MAPHIIFGMPGSGKTTLATMLAIQAMDRGITVFSNYPIYHAKTGTFTKRWSRDYVQETIYKSLIIIDEGYLDYSSREGGAKYAKKVESGGGFTKDEHTMFATSRHNDNDFFIIAQNYARIELIIREISLFWHVQPIKIPLLGWMLGIKISSYSMEQQIDLKAEAEGTMYYFRWPFVSLMARAFKSFDTHFYKKVGEMRTDFPAWTGKETINDVIEANKITQQGPGRQITDGGRVWSVATKSIHLRQRHDDTAANQGDRGSGVDNNVGGLGTQADGP